MASQAGSFASAFLVLLPFSLGCSDRPKAPPLAAEALYQNEKVGVRFLTPVGWQISSRTDLPPGVLPKPVILISYLLMTGEKPAEFELVAADVPEDVDLGQFLAEHRIGPTKWTVKAGGQPSQVGGEGALRYEMTVGSGKDEIRREATVVRRGGRVFYFVITFSPRDDEHRDQAKRSIESVTWTK